MQDLGCISLDKGFLVLRYTINRNKALDNFENGFHCSKSIPMEFPWILCKTKDVPLNKGFNTPLPHKSPEHWVTHFTGHKC